MGRGNPVMSSARIFGAVSEALAADLTEGLAVGGRCGYCDATMPLISDSSHLTIALANSGRKWIGEIAHVAMLYRELEKLGHRPWVICREGFALHEHALREGWRVLALKFNSRFHPASDWADARRWAEWARAQHPAVLHCHRGKDHWLGAAVSRMTSVPLVRTRHVVTPVRRHLFNRWLYFRATRAALSVSEAAANSFGPWRPHLPNAQVILSAVDHNRFMPTRRSLEWRRIHSAKGFEGLEAGRNEPFWFGLVGRFHRIKGHQYFFEAAARIAAEFPQAHFLMAGAGGMEKKQALRERAQGLGFADRLVIAGHLEDLPTLLASLDVGVIASIGSEGSSRIGLEMMASGLPVVATRVGGIPDLLERGPGDPGDGPGGILVPPRNPEAMAEGMRAFIRDRELRERAGRWNRERVIRHHDPAAWAERIVGVYRGVIGQQY
jgi:glycosyltransferase involved in cell wall biosynthesis